MCGSLPMGSPFGGDANLCKYIINRGQWQIFPCTHTEMSEKIRNIAANYGKGSGFMEA